MLESKITSDTLQFLNTLKKNNNREWFAEHKVQFKKEEEKAKDFFNQVLDKMKIHDEIERLKVFRIYRDVRFSKDKTPYKNSFSAFYSRAGLHRRGGYYVHIQPGANFIGAGFWKPDKPDLFRIRKEWDNDTSELLEIIENKTFKRVWGNLYGAELKTAPKGFDKDNPNIELIRKKQYLYTRSFTDKEVLASNFAEQINESFKLVRPYFDLMSAVLTTNLNGGSLLD
jgi:uncharacterized protein (TIGR02453 family)